MRTRIESFGLVLAVSLLQRTLASISKYLRRFTACDAACAVEEPRRQPSKSYDDVLVAAHHDGESAARRARRPGRDRRRVRRCGDFLGPRFAVSDNEQSS